MGSCLSSTMLRKQEFSNTYYISSRLLANKRAARYGEKRSLDDCIPNYT